MAQGTGYGYGKISITLGKHLFDKVNEIAEREGRSFASVVREILTKQLDDGQG